MIQINLFIVKNYPNVCELLEKPNGFRLKLRWDVAWLVKGRLHPSMTDQEDVFTTATHQIRQHIWQLLLTRQVWCTVFQLWHPLYTACPSLLGNFSNRPQSHRKLWSTSDTICPAVSFCHFGKVWEWCKQSLMKHVPKGPKRICSITFNLEELRNQGGTCRGEEGLGGIQHFREKGWPLKRPT